MINDTKSRYAVLKASARFLPEQQDELDNFDLMSRVFVDKLRGVNFGDSMAKQLVFALGRFCENRYTQEQWNALFEEKGTEDGAD